MNVSSIKPCGLVAALLVLGVVGWARPSHAYKEGITGYSGNPNSLGQGIICTGCHHVFGAGVLPPVVHFEGLDHVTANAIATFRFVVQSQVPATQVAAGFNVSADGGNLNIVANQMEVLTDGELTHTSPLPGQLGGKPNDANGVASWDFRWTPPSNAGIYHLYGAGNSVNDDGSLNGDRAASTVFTVVVEEAPPTPIGQVTATSTSLATATSTPTPTATPASALCVGDCDRNGIVSVDELVLGVNIALGLLDGVDRCPALDKDHNGRVTVDELVVGINDAVNGCSACGNGVVDFNLGETCDDGNTVEGDSCPANCRIAACAAASSMVTVDVSFTPPEGVDAAGLAVFVRYPDGVVSIPGVANDPSVQDRLTNLPDNTFSVPNDLDYALRLAILSVDSSPIPPGRLFTVRFDTCQGAPPPAVSDFRCTVESAADPQGQTVSGTTCAIALP